MCRLWVSTSQSSVRTVHGCRGCVQIMCVGYASVQRTCRVRQCQPQQLRSYSFSSAGSSSWLQKKGAEPTFFMYVHSIYVNITCIYISRNSSVSLSAQTLCHQCVHSCCIGVHSRPNLRLRFALWLAVSSQISTYRLFVTPTWLRLMNPALYCMHVHVYFCKSLLLRLNRDLLCLHIMHAKVQGSYNH